MMSSFKKTVLCICLALMGCNENDHDNQKVSTPKTVTVLQSKLSIDPAIPQSVRSQITNIVTPLSNITGTEGFIGTSEVESVVMALDANGQIRMAGVVVGAQATQLSAKSTALGLVRLAMALPGNMTEKKLNDYIRTAASFNNVITAVNNSFNTGTVVSTDTAVLAKVLETANEVGQRIANLEASSANVAVSTLVSSVSRVLPTTPSVTPTPFALVKNEDALGEIEIDADKRVTNSIPIAWDITAKNYQGNVLPHGKIALPAAGFLNRISTAVSDWGTFGLIVDYFGSKSVTVPDDNGRSFELTVAQTEETRKANLTRMMVDLISADINIAAKGEDETCKAAIISTIISTQGMEKLVSLDTADAYIKSLKSAGVNVIVSALLSSPKISAKCDRKTRKYFVYVAMRISPTLYYTAELYKSLEKVYKYASVAERLYVQAKHWNREKTYTVCMGASSGFFGDKKSIISNCATKLEVEPKNLTLTAGAEVNLTIKALDAKGKETLPPAHLDPQPFDQNKITIDQNGKLTALAIGNATLTMTDLPTGVSTESFAINIVAPRLNKTEIKLKVGEAVTLPLQDSQGRNITYNGLTEWGSSPSGVVTINGLNTSKSRATQMEIKGLKEGTAAIVGNNLADGSSTEILTVSVEGEKCPDGSAVNTDGSCPINRFAPGYPISFSGTEYIHNKHNCPRYAQDPYTVDLLSPSYWMSEYSYNIHKYFQSSPISFHISKAGNGKWIPDNISFTRTNTEYVLLMDIPVELEIAIDISENGILTTNTKAHGYGKAGNLQSQTTRSATEKFNMNTGEYSYVFNSTSDWSYVNNGILCSKSDVPAGATEILEQKATGKVAIQNETFFGL